MRLNGSVLLAAGDVSDGYNTDFRSDAKGKFGRTLFKLSVLGMTNGGVIERHVLPPN